MKIYRILQYLTITFILLCYQLTVSAQTWQWAKQMGGNAFGVNLEDGREEVCGMTID